MSSCIYCRDLDGFLFKKKEIILQINERWWTCNRFKDRKLQKTIYIKIESLILYH